MKFFCARRAVQIFFLLSPTSFIKTNITETRGGNGWVGTGVVQWVKGKGAQRGQMVFSLQSLHHFGYGWIFMHVDECVLQIFSLQPTQ